VTQKEATIEAQKRWGVHAEALIEGAAWTESMGMLSSYEIDGCIRDTHVVCCGHYDYRGRDESNRCEDHWGQGDTWEAALADADQRITREIQ
jgi:hypothetical protein